MALKANNSAFQITSFLILYLFYDLLPPAPSFLFLYIFSLLQLLEKRRKRQEKSRNSLPQQLHIQQLFSSYCLPVRLRNSKLIRSRYNQELQVQEKLLVLQVSIFGSVDILGWIGIHILY